MEKPCKSCNGCILRSIYGLEALSNAHQSIRTLNHQEIIVQPGDVPDSIKVLKSGYAMRYQLLPSGRRHIHSFLVPGYPLSTGFLHPLLASSTTAMAMREAELCDVDINLPVRAEAEDGEAAIRKFEFFRHYFGFVTIMKRDMAVCTAHQRICRLLYYYMLWEQGGRIPAPDTEIAMTRPLTLEILADMAGVTSVHASRIINSLKKAGIVSWTRKNLSIEQPGVLCSESALSAVDIANAESVFTGLTEFESGGQA